jgi:hypothetical protein
VQGSFAVKLPNCMACDFYKSDHYSPNTRSPGVRAA